MNERHGPARPDPDSTGGLLADWNIGDDASKIAPVSPAPAGPDHVPADIKSDHRPSGSAEIGAGSTGSAGFLSGFDLGESDQSGLLQHEGSIVGPASTTVRRQPRPTGASWTVPRWTAHREHEPGPVAIRPQSSHDFPRAGDVLAGFRIIRELGRGAFARVYLAEELHLGGRLVAIKVSRAQGDEPRILARLQHTHIVPVHSAYDDPTTGLRILCMPYFGGANLAQVLDAAGGLTSTERAGHSLVEVLDQISRHQQSAPSQAANPSPAGRLPGSSRHGPDSLPPPESLALNMGLSLFDRSPLVCGFRTLYTRIVGARTTSSIGHHPPAADDHPHQPALQFLRGASAVQASVWIAARLAEGLDHAHSRGLLHRDLKPANILIAADGTPMLLDFNLAAESLPQATEGEIGRAMVGGTLPYMAPEHLDAFNPRGSTAPEAVDERADLYALGLILFEMLAGEHAFPDFAPSPGTPLIDVIQQMADARRSPPSLRARCPQVPWSLDALVGKCLAFDPARRYARARDVAEDLRRFLDDLPMKHCPEPSLRERAGKFLRRHPGLGRTSSIALISLVLITMLGAAVVAGYSALQDLGARVRRQGFEREFAETQFLLNTAGPSDDHLTRGIAKAGAIFKQLGIDDDSPPPSSGWILRLTHSERRRVREQVVELMMLESRASVLLATRHGTEADRRDAILRAIDRLNLAERFDAPAPSALFEQRARYNAALGESKLADRDRRRAAMTPPTTCHDWTLLGTTRVANGDPRGAEDALRQALRLDGTSFWTWFMMGHCHYAQGRFLEAAGDFAACSVRGPSFGWTHFNRGLALARAGLLDAAKDAYDHALECDPEFAEALVDRALVELELNQLEEALSDLSHAARLGRKDIGVMAAHGEALARLGRIAEAERLFGSLLASNPDDAVVRVARAMTRLRTDPQRARDDFENVLRRDPNHAVANYGMALVIRSRDARAALHHLDIALDSNPHLIDAVQIRALVRARLGDPAALDDVDRLLKIPTARRYYNAACAVALYAETAHDPRQLPHAMELLTRAVQSGFPASEAADDPDLKPLRSLPAFQQLGTGRK